MHHPIFQSIRSLFIYLAAWIMISVIHAVVLFYYYLPDITLAVYDSISFNLTFAFLGMAVWFTVRYSIPSRANFINILVNQLTSLITILFMWFGLAWLLFYIFKSYNTSYEAFFFKSIPWRVISGVFYYFIIALVYYLIIYYHNLNEKMLNEVKLMTVLKETELNLLKSQINPHFLFNSLNSISSLTITDAVKAQEMIIKLSDFLRYTITMDTEGFSKLRKEIENINRYLEIEKVRFDDKLSYVFEVDDACMEHKLPQMILQPLYENAIKHGVYESTEPIQINTVCRKTGRFLEITIRNNYEQALKSKKGTGLGLKNTRERLKLLYQDDQLLKILKTENTFELRLLIPSRS